MNTKKLFVLYDEFTKQDIIPNGFNMSQDELLRHRFKIHSNSNVSFSIPYIISTLDNYVPIHIETFLANKKMFADAGKIIYVINLHRSANSYYELYTPGMNFWLNYLDPRILKSFYDNEIKLVVSCLIETCDINYLNFILAEFYSFIKDKRRIENFEFWLPFSLPESDLQKIPNHLRSCVVSVPFWEWQTLKMQDQFNISENLDRSKKYISLCRRYTKERVLVHSYLRAQNLLENGYNSIPEKDTNSTMTLKDYMIKIKDNINLSEFNNYLDICIKGSCNGITLDKNPIREEDRTFGKRSYFGFDENLSLEKFYNDSYISIIQEAEVSSGTYIASEKTFRAMMYRHPFVTIGPYKFLESLQAAGYKTFEEYIPEDYDKIENTEKRLSRVLQIFTSLVKEGNLPKLYKKTADILEHNRNHVIYRRDLFINKYRL